MRFSARAQVEPSSRPNQNSPPYRDLIQFSLPSIVVVENRKRGARLATIAGTKAAVWPQNKSSMVCENPGGPSQIREHCGVEPDAVHTAEGKRMRRNFHRHRTWPRLNLAFPRQLVKKPETVSSDSGVVFAAVLNPSRQDGTRSFQQSRSDNPGLATPNLPGTMSSFSRSFP